MDKQIYVYINNKGRVIETIPIDVCKDYSKSRFYSTGLKAIYDRQQLAEEKVGDGYVRHISGKEGEIKNNQLWLHCQDISKAKALFKVDAQKRLCEIRKQFDNLLTEVERLS